MNPEPRREGITELLRGQKRGIAVALSKAKEELRKLGRRAAKGGIQREVLEDRVRKALQREHLSEFVIATVKEERGQITLNWHVDPVRRRLLERTRLGRRVLCTDHHVWSTGRIVYAFRGQWNVEELFRRAKKGGIVSCGLSHQWAGPVLTADQRKAVQAFDLERWRAPGCQSPVLRLLNAPHKANFAKVGLSPILFT